VSLSAWSDEVSDAIADSSGALLVSNVVGVSVVCVCRRRRHVVVVAVCTTHWSSYGVVCVCVWVCGCAWTCACVPACVRACVRVLRARV
jgi:hypothetical protein